MRVLPSFFLPVHWGLPQYDCKAHVRLSSVENNVNRLLKKFICWHCDLWVSHCSYSKTCSGRHVYEGLFGHHQSPLFESFSCKMCHSLIEYAEDTAFSIAACQIDAMVMKVRCKVFNELHKYAAQHPPLLFWVFEFCWKIMS